MKLTYGRIITSFVLIGISFLVMQAVPSGDCSKLYQDKIKIMQCNDMQTLGTIIVIMTVVIVMIIIIGGIFSKEEDKIERPWDKLPKGFEQPNRKENSQ